MIAVIRDKNIVCFASGWNYHPTSKHHIMRKLAEHNHVIWVNWHASRCPTPQWADLRSVFSKLRQIRRGPTSVSERITVITPPQLPLPGSPWARRLNGWLVKQAVSRVLRRLPDRPVQTWTFAPDVAEVIGRFNEELSLYYCVDAFGEFPGYNRSLIDHLETDLLAKSDVVITTSRPLYDAKHRKHPNVHLVEHGVDYTHLSRAVTENLTVPEDLRRLPKPVFGFVGVMGKWVDLDLVAGLARRCPHASIALIGPMMTSRSCLSELKNVHWLGAKDHQVLPNYLRGFDVALIPFRRVPLTHHVNPIKLFEYLAAGAPVVSSSLPAVRPIPGSVWLADDAATTAQCCQEALTYNAESDRRERSNSMKIESWSARLEQLDTIVSEVLQRHTRPVGKASDKPSSRSAASFEGCFQPSTA